MSQPPMSPVIPAAELVGSIDELVLLCYGWESSQLHSWAKVLQGLVIVREIEDLENLSPPRDTLVVALDLNGEAVKSLNELNDLASVRVSSTRVVGIYIDREMSPDRNSQESRHSETLYWLRSISDMVVVSSDSGVVLELVETLAKSTLQALS